MTGSSDQNLKSNSFLKVSWNLKSPGTSSLLEPKKVANGIEVAKRCNYVLNQIVEHVTVVDGMVSDIAVASEEQSKGIGEITRAMGQLDQATQINADSSRQMAFSSEELSMQARKLNSLVSELKLTIQGR